MDTTTRKLQFDSPHHKVRTFGISDFDHALDGGIGHGETWIIAGPTGSGKTTIGVQFLAHGVACGEPGLYISSTESPARMLHYFSESCPDLEFAVTNKQLAILDPSPFFTELRQNVSQKKSSHQDNWNAIWRFAQDVVKQSRYQDAQRIVIDPITPLLFAHESMAELWDLAQMLITSFGQNNGSSTLMMHTIGGSEKHRNISDVMEEIAGGCIHVQHKIDQHASDEIQIEILKHRHHPIKQRFLRYQINENGQLTVPTEVFPYDIAS